MLTILINGICGQMGRAVYNAVQASDGAFFAACGVDAASCPGFDCPIYQRYDEVTEKVDVVIDFSIPAALPSVLRFALQRQIPVVVGTTGLSERDKKLIRKTADRIPVFQTGNMSLGVNLQMELVRTAAATLGEDFDVEIIEKHHRKKVDAPSGTALMLANSVSMEHTGEPEYVFGRHEKNKRRTIGEIGMHSIRGGTIVGEHAVLFIGNDEIVEITHKAYSKQVFARGALRAAQYLTGKKNGLYNMQNIVTEHDVASRLFSLEDQAAVTVSGLPDGMNAVSRVFEQIAGRGVFVDMIALSLPVGGNCCIGFSLNQGQLPAAMDALAPLKAAFPAMETAARSELTKLTVEGPGMALQHGVAAKLLEILAKAGVRVQLITTSETKIEFCVDTFDVEKTVTELKENFIVE